MVDNHLQFCDWIKNSEYLFVCRYCMRFLANTNSIQRNFGFLLVYLGNGRWDTIAVIIKIKEIWRLAIVFLVSIHFHPASCSAARWKRMNTQNMIADSHVSFSLVKVVVYTPQIHCCWENEVSAFISLVFCFRVINKKKKTNVIMGSLWIIWCIC